jgi:hypothetical protein
LRAQRGGGQAVEETLRLFVLLLVLIVMYRMIRSLNR